MKQDYVDASTFLCLRSALHVGSASFHTALTSAIYCYDCHVSSYLSSAEPAGVLWLKCV